MSSEEIIGSSSIVPEYNKDKKAIEIHLSIQHNEVLVVSNNNTKRFTYANLNPFEIVFQNQNCTVNNNFNCQENRNPQKDPIIEINIHHQEMELGHNLHRSGWHWRYGVTICVRNGNYTLGHDERSKDKTKFTQTKERLVTMYYCWERLCRGWYPIVLEGYNDANMNTLSYDS
ncbi:hypothetical protein MTR_2g438290 [Medicago truncatula]|uniref:Uncharacterized protein n=1 Tax=Medicago truncatula TaxID=3880 RepID=A0A072V7T0_MEDTR|nr:hypothetical protein MTR_2g438290 [Medicago truncatula]